ncbi:TonB-dependent receptor plug domain-containing protein [Pseudoduganella namucuonensis]|nr:TonB-dependent receptor [Pseudoduganella namucuonensis]
MAITILCSHAAVMARQAEGKLAPPPASTEPAPGVAAPKAGELVKVEVKGALESYDPRREDTASKTVLTHEEIIKYGDTNVFDVLKRAPGVTVIGNSIRLRGLGNGYTQVLVNGERPPPGFSMEALTPDQIDRIEVIRAATAEHSTQAIAGTINIVLSKVVSRTQRDLRLNASRSGEQHKLMALGTLADRSGKLSYYLNAMMSQNVDGTPGSTVQLLAAPDGQVLQSREKRSTRDMRTTSGGLLPRLNWKLDNDGQLNWNTYLQGQRSRGGFSNLTTSSVGAFAPPDYRDSRSTSNVDDHFAGTDLNWVAKLWGGKLDAKLGVSKGRASIENRALSSTADRVTMLRRDTDTTNDFGNVNTSGKYARSLFDGHALAVGWEANFHKVDENIDRTEGLAGVAPKTIHEVFTPRVKRRSVFAQDEWNITTNWSMYLGARWEGIRTASEGSGQAGTTSRSGVLSPIAQTLYKFPGGSGRQLRMALTRTYKAPNTYQLSARRYEADQNDRFNPDTSGNPRLRPELANGLDVTYEHFWAPGAVLSVGGSARQIKDYIRGRLAQDAQGRWLVQPLNNGTAQVRTLDVELKFPLKAVMTDAPPFDIRASVNRNWSRVESVPGPDNRLDQQVPLSAVFGVDYKVDTFSAGANLAVRAGGPVRVSEEQRSRMQARRELELYLLYKIGTGLQLRSGVSNALGEDTLGDTSYEDGRGTSRSWSRGPGSAKLQVNLEMKL